MSSRHDISDEDWSRIEHLLPGRRGQHGGVAADNRRFVNAVRYVARTGVAWADLPDGYGKANSVWRRFDRWCTKGVWTRLRLALADGDAEWLSADSTIFRAAACAAGAKKSGTARAGRPSRPWAARAAASAVSCTR